MTQTPGYHVGIVRFKDRLQKKRWLTHKPCFQNHPHRTRSAHLAGYVVLWPHAVQTLPCWRKAHHKAAENAIETLSSWRRNLQGGITRRCQGRDDYRAAAWGCGGKKMRKQGTTKSKSEARGDHSVFQADATARARSLWRCIQSKASHRPPQWKRPPATTAVQRQP